MEAWGEDIRDGWKWRPDHADPVSDCPACGCVTTIPKESVFKCDACSVEIVRELHVMETA
jgi:hypothetical protein